MIILIKKVNKQINDIITDGTKKVFLINGPSHDQQEVFDWTTTTCKQTNPLRFTIYGQVDKYDFDMVEYNVELL